jgi:broad specificity phosphatase PhoE
MLYFFRHAECEANVQGVLAGKTNDSPLTTLGEEQAAAGAEYISQQDIRFERIATSPLSRARRTAEIVARSLNFSGPILDDARLIEFDMGVFTGKPSAGLTSDMLLAAQGTEDPSVFRERVSTALKDYTRMTGNTLIISHGGVGRMIEVLRLQLDPREFFDLQLYPNATLIPLSNDSR